MSKPQARIPSIDALRGLAILGMALSGMLPWGSLPAWMYHAQSPPPSMEFNPAVAGITWVDWVFPFFLFALGAAIPLSLQRHLDSPTPWHQTLLNILKRGGLILAFAYVSQHLRPFSYSATPNANTWMLSLLFFFATVAAFVRIPDQWPKTIRYCIGAFGWLIILAGIFALKPDGSRQADLQKVDIILFVLANVSVSGSVIWWLTRQKPLARITIFGIVSILFFASQFAGPVQVFWQFDPLPNLWHWDFQKYLLIVIPGTFCGEFILNHSEHKESLNHTPGAALTITLTAIILLVSVTATLLMREVEIALFISILAAALGLIIAQIACHFSEGMKNMIRSGAVLLIIGIVLDPVVGGIKKDPANLSYMFTLSGLAFWLVAALADLTKTPKRLKWLGWLTATGVNPLLGYVAITNFVPAFIRLTPINEFIGNQGFSPWQLFGYALFQTAIVAAICVFATRYKIYLRA
ncbi:MAG: DUF5009 domain-containing protein [Fimbriimonadaceae bacterium]